jgi:hypothetical protein
VQLLCALAGLVLVLLLPRITLDSTVAGTRETEALVAVGFGVPGLVTVIFSLLFLIVQWAFTGLPPWLTPVPRRPDRVADLRPCRRVFVLSVTIALIRPCKLELAGQRSRSAPVHQAGGAGCGSSAGLVCEGPCTGGAASLTFAWRAMTASRVTLKTVRSWVTVTGPL